MVYGTIDEKEEDDTVYDHVIFAADFGPIKSIFDETYKNYKSEKKVANSLEICNENYFSKMKIAPDYRGTYDEHIFDMSFFILIIKEIVFFSPIFNSISWMV